MHPNDVSAAFTQLKEEGKVLHFGVSNFSPSQMALINNATPISINQIEFSLTHFEAMHDGTLDYMLGHQITPMAWSPLGSVFREESERTERISSLLGELKEKYNATEDQLLLAWLMKHPAGILPVVGTTNKLRLTNALKASEIPLDLEDWFLLLVASQGHKVP